MGRRRTPKKPRKASPKSLENAAIYYLKRYASSAANLKSVLMRRVLKSAGHHGTDVEEGRGWVDDVIFKLQNSGYLDDQKYAETRIHSLYSRGLSLRAIRMKLSEKGVPVNIVTEALRVLSEEAENPEFQAAIITAQRRKLGPYRTRGDRQENRERDLASLARGGFSYDIAVKVVDTDTAGELEDYITLDPS
ncbi:MAG: regulator [Rhodospirillaceae bacterium]|nr:regulator [Rhodospirillaceae bacterium]